MKYRIIPVTAYQQNCSLIWCEHTNKAALIDPGGESEKLLALIEQEQLTLDKILLTHGHLDHVGAAKELSIKTGAPIIGPHEADMFWFEQLPVQAQMFSFPMLEAFLPDQWLQDGDIVQVGKISLDVLHCPGHTPGHVVFFDAASLTVFVGDVLFHGSVGRSDFPQGSHEALINSIKQKLLPLGDGVDFVPGHGPGSTLGHERLHNPFL